MVMRMEKDPSEVRRTYPSATGDVGDGGRARLILSVFTA